MGRSPFARLAFAWPEACQVITGTPTKYDEFASAYAVGFLGLHDEALDMLAHVSGISIFETVF